MHQAEQSIYFVWASHQFPYPYNLTESPQSTFLSEPGGKSHVTISRMRTAKNYVLKLIAESFINER